MLSTTMVLAATMLGVDTGWRPVEDGNGGLEYIIQIEPELLEALQNGERITSEIPAEVHGVRRYRIMVGNETLPREGASDQTALKPPATGKPTLPPDMPDRMPTEAGLRPVDAGLRPPAVDRAGEQELENPPYPGATFAPRDAPLPATETEPAPLPVVAGDTAGTADPLPATDVGSRYGGGESPAAATGPRPFAAAPPRDLKTPLRSTPLGPTEPAVSWPADHGHDHDDHAGHGAGDQQPNRLAAYDETDRSVATTAASPGDVPAATATTPSAVPPGMGKWMLALGALFASLAANLYLGWVTWDTRQRYRDLVYERQGES